MLQRPSTVRDEGEVAPTPGMDGGRAGGSASPQAYLLRLLSQSQCLTACGVANADESTRPQKFRTRPWSAQVRLKSVSRLPSQDYSRDSVRWLIRLIRASRALNRSIRAFGVHSNRSQVHLLPARQGSPRVSIVPEVYAVFDRKRRLLGLGLLCSRQHQPVPCPAGALDSRGTEGPTLRLLDSNRPRAMRKMGSRLCA